MKNNDLLYELMEEINDTEVAMIEKEIEESVDDVTLKRQENMVLQRIYVEAGENEGFLCEHVKNENEEALDMQKNKLQQKSRRRIKKRKVLVLVAVAVMMFGMMAFARANDWDIEFLSAIGLNGAMEELEGGYVEIGKSDTQDGIKVTAVRSIGDQNHQWIQIDTDVVWDVDEDGYYMFDKFDYELYKLTGSVGGHSASWYSYNNDGKVSFMFQLNVKKINRVKVSIELGDLYKCEDKDDDNDRTLISDGEWKLQWKNYYAPNTFTNHPMKTIDGNLIYAIVVSPISMRVETTGGDYNQTLDIEKITLENGTEIQCSYEGGGKSESPYGVFSHEEVFYGDNQCIDLDKIKSVTINGVEIKLN